MEEQMSKILDNCDSVVVLSAKDSDNMIGKHEGTGKSYTEALIEQGLIVVLDTFDETIIREALENSKMIQFSNKPTRGELKVLLAITSELSEQTSSDVKSFFDEACNYHCFGLPTQKNKEVITDFKGIVNTKKQPKEYQKFNKKTWQ